jgi:uncharacterized membrane protein
MDSLREKIEELTRRINELAQQQTNVSRQLIQLVNELELIKQQAATSSSVAPEPLNVPEKVIEFKKPIEAPVQAHKVLTHIQQRPVARPVKAKSNTTFEEFIGKNVASKVGILVTIVGIFIGAKYAIEHNLVSPVVRILSGYLCGVALVAIAFRLKKKYEAYSAVLMGGGIAVVYFITFIAYSAYNLIPQLPAFGLMLLFTVGTVYVALLFNRVIIAHLGQVGAYAIPFLLSNDSGRYEILFTYIAIINSGILVLSFRKYWKSLFYSAFIVTWLIFSLWFAFTYQQATHFNLAIIFLCIFFGMFYATFLAYKLVKKEQYGVGDVMILLSNAFIFYGLGYAILIGNSNTENYLGIFTVVNALIHLVISETIRRLKLADTALYYFILGLVMVFLTIAIPVQLDGNWVTLLWTAEAVMVFIVGRTRKAGAYEKIGSTLVVLGFLSLWQDWMVYLSQLILFTSGKLPATPFFSILFATGILVCIAQAVIIYFNRNKKYTSALPDGNFFRGFYDYVVPILFIVCCYFIFLWEIKSCFTQLRASYSNLVNPIKDINAFSFITQLLYTMIFWLLLTLINRNRIRNNVLSGACLIGILLLIVVFLIPGLPVLNGLSANYHRYDGNQLYFGVWDVLIRYVVFIVAGVLLYLGKGAVRERIQEPLLHNAWGILIHFVTLSCISAEYLHQATAIGVNDQYKLGLSILWGLYALYLIIYGIWKKKKYLRLVAIVLFSITLLKLFLYDLSEAGTITKTISFISLGVILLLVSYLYNRYKEKLFGDGKPT